MEGEKIDDKGSEEIIHENDITMGNGNSLTFVMMGTRTMTFRWPNWLSNLDVLMFFFCVMALMRYTFVLDKQLDILDFRFQNQLDGSS